jgi:hypothetical protein
VARNSENDKKKKGLGGNGWAYFSHWRPMSRRRGVHVRVLEAELGQALASGPEEKRKGEKKEEAN